MKRKRSREQGHCIFCNGVGLSKEHIWSDWLKALIPSNEAHGEHWAAMHRERGDKETEWMERPQSRARQGCVLQRKIRNVCERHCNNGWMSRVVNRAKPHAQRLIQGHPISLDRQAQTDLSAWVGITTIMQEFANPRGVRKIPDEDGKQLMNREAPPDTWSIWIAGYEGQWWAPMDHYSIPMTYSKGPLHGERKSNDAPLYGLQLLTFTLGNLLVHVFTSTHAEMIEEYRTYINRATNSNGLQQLWPIVVETLPPLVRFNDDEVDLLAFDWVQTRWRVQGLPGRPQEVAVLKFAKQLATYLGTRVGQ